MERLNNDLVNNMNIQDVVQEIIDIRDHFKAIEEERKKVDAPFLARDAELKSEVMRRCEAEGRNNQRTNAGTAYLAEMVSVRMGDPDVFREWVKETGNWTTAEIRASKTGVEDWVSEFSELPPGIRREVTVIVKVKRE